MHLHRWRGKPILAGESPSVPGPDFLITDAAVATMRPGSPYGLIPAVLRVRFGASVRRSLRPSFGELRRDRSRGGRQRHCTSVETPKATAVWMPPAIARMQDT